MNHSVSIGGRLREERERLEMNQTAFGAVGGVTKKTQVLYEAGERMPDAGYLAAVASAGADVLYVLTGQPGPLLAVRVGRALEDMPKPGDAMATVKVATALSGVARPGDALRELNARQRALLDNFDASPEEGKRVIEGTANLAAESGAGRRGKKA